MFENLFYIQRILFVLFILVILSIYYKKHMITFVIIIIFLGLLFFFRSNVNSKEYDKNVFISPSSSKVIHIKENDTNYDVFSYLSPLDKHFMIAPIDCTIISIEDAKTEKDSERKRITFQDYSNNEFIIDLIVSKPFHGIGVFGGWLPKLFYDERIVVTKKVGEKLKRGEQFGLIRFGSNIQYYIPKTYSLNMKEQHHYNIGEKIALLNSNK